MTKFPQGLASFILISFFHTFGFSQNLDWVKTVGGNGTEYGQFQVVNGSGTIYNVGAFGDTINIDPNGMLNVSPMSLRDFFIQKMDARGNLIWARSIGGSDVSDKPCLQVYQVLSDDKENVYVTGSYYHRIDFDPGPMEHIVSGSGGFILKLDANGSFTWVRTFEGTVNTYGSALSVDYKGNVFVGGSFREKTDFDPGSGVVELTPQRFFDLFVLKLDVNGVFQWVKQMAGDNSCRVSEMRLDSKGNICYVGWFSGTVDFDPGVSEHKITATGSNDHYIQKLDPNGNLIWIKTIGGAGVNLVSHPRFELDEFDNVYIVSNYYGSVDFNPGPGIDILVSSKVWVPYLLKLDENGQFVWAKNLGLSERLWIGDIAISGEGSIFTTGSFGQITNFNPSGSGGLLTNQGDMDVYIQKLDENGQFVYVKHIKGKVSAYSSEMNIDTSGNLYIIGNYSDSTDFDPDIGVAWESSRGEFDVFIVKLSECNTFSRIYDTICSNDSLLFGGQFVKTEGRYSDTLDWAQGCDSIVTLFLAVNPSYEFDDVQRACDQFTWVDGIMYSVSTDTATYTYKTVTGCDSVAHLKLTILNTPVLRVSNDTLVCFGDRATLSAQTNGSALLWSTGDTTSSIYAPAGRYFVQSSSEGCIAKDSIWVQSSSPIDIPVDDVYVVCMRDSIFAQVDVGASFQDVLWWPSMDTGQMIQIKKPGDYKVSITDFLGCKAEKAVIAQQRCDLRFYMPNAFSPNQDGVNDVFRALGDGIVKQNMKVFNRWGELVYESEDGSGWDGSGASTGVYIYVIHLEGYENGEIKFVDAHGRVTLLR